MNPLTNVKNTQKLNEKELELGLVGSKSSWHEDFKDSAWIFVGGLPYDLTEGDIICIFSQYGEIVNINLVRDKQTGKSKGFCFICYEDQRSTILAVDNLNAIKLLGRTLRVNHVANYKMPKEHEDDDEVTRQIREEGCAPTVMIHNNGEGENEDEEEGSSLSKKLKKEKKKKKKRKKSDEAETNSEQSTTADVTDERSKKGHFKIKEERHDPGYEKYNRHNERSGPSNKNPHLSVRLKEEQTIRSEPEHEKKERFYSDHSLDEQRLREDDRNRGRDDETRASRREEDDRRHLGSHRDRDSSSEVRSSRAESRTSDRQYTGSEGYNKKDSDTRPSRSRSRHTEDERVYSRSQRGRDTGDDIERSRNEHSDSDKRHRRDSDTSYDKMRREHRYRYEYEDNTESKRRDGHEEHYDYAHGRRRETDSGMRSHQDTRKYSETRNSEHRHPTRLEEHHSPHYRSSREYSPYSRKEKSERIYRSHESRRERQRSRSPLGSYEKMKITVEIRK